MMDFPKKEVVDAVKKQYPPGTRIALVSMEDPYSKLQPGDRGTVLGVDDIGTIHAAWDCGSGLGIAYDVDFCRKLTQSELDEEQNTLQQELNETQTLEMG